MHGFAKFSATQRNIGGRNGNCHGHYYGAVGGIRAALGNCRPSAKELPADAAPGLLAGHDHDDREFVAVASGATTTPLDNGLCIHAFAVRRDDADFMRRLGQ